MLCWSQNVINGTDNWYVHRGLWKLPAERLQKSYDLNLKLLADCYTHAEKLQNELKETKEFTARLQAVLDDHTQVENLKQALK